MVEHTPALLDDGVSWTQTSLPVEAQWSSVLSSSDGSRLTVFSSNNGGIYSIDGGAHWNRVL